MKAGDYTTITERRGMPMSREQLAMARCRYELAAACCRGRDVLEIGCGTGFGLSFLAPLARRALGADLMEANLREARSRGLTVCRLDAERLPFAPASFDVVLMLEVIYYLPDPRAALAECRRVLRGGGRMLVCLPNPDAPGFHRSPLSAGYFSAPALAALLREAGFEPSLYGGFPLGADGLRGRLVRRGTDVADRLGLLPRTLGGRSRLKRLVCGPLGSFERLEEVDVGYPAPEPIGAEEPTRAFRNLYGEGVKLP